MATTHHDTRTPTGGADPRDPRELGDPGGRRRRWRLREADAVALGGLLILALNLLDLITTRFALGIGATEANPVMEPFADRWPLLLAVKVGLPGLLAWFLWRRRSEATPVLVAAVVTLVAVYTAVVVVNLSHLL